MTDGWRKLAVFWGSVIVLAGAGAATLKLLGPPVPKPATPDAEPPAAVLATAPAPDPAPVPVKTTPIRPPDPALLAPAPDFANRFLPRRAADGRASMSVYARAPTPLAHRPAVALLLAGLGQSEADSRVASAVLPAAISFGVSPYTANPDALLADFREHGHEYFVTLPMESQGYPLNDSGPRALLTGAEPTVNDRNLEWVLSRMQGEVGLTGASDGLFGERFAGAWTLFAPVLDQIKARGLLYVDPRPAPAGQLPGEVTTLVVDEPPDRASIEAKLAQLEQRARDGETVIGVAGLLRPVTMERVAAWARGLEGRGMVLEPVSALARPR